MHRVIVSVFATLTLTLMAAAPRADDDADFTIVKVACQSAPKVVFKNDGAKSVRLRMEVKAGTCDETVLSALASIDGGTVCRHKSGDEDANCMAFDVAPGKSVDGLCTDDKGTGCAGCSECSFSFTKINEAPEPQPD